MQNINIYKEILKILGANEKQIEISLNLVKHILERFEKNVYVSALNDDTRLYLLKDENGFLSTENIILNRIIRNTKEAYNINDEIAFEKKFVELISKKEYFKYLYENKEYILKDKSFKEYFAYLLDILELLNRVGAKNIINKDILDFSIVKVEDIYNKGGIHSGIRTEDLKVEITEKTSIEEVIVFAKKQEKSKQIREKIQKDPELLKFELESKENQEKYPNGINNLQVEKFQQQNKIENEYLFELSKLQKDNIPNYIFDILEIAKLENGSLIEFLNAIDNIIGEKEIFEKIFFNANNMAYKNIFECGYSLYTLNKLLYDINSTDENIRNAAVIEFQNSEFNHRKSNKISNLKLENPKIDKIEIINFIDNAIKNYVLTENKYQISRRDEDEEQYVDLIYNLIYKKNNINNLDIFEISNNVVTTDKIILIIRMLLTAKLMSIENTVDIYTFLLNEPIIINIIANSKNNKYYNAIQTVASQKRLSEDKEVTRIEHDRNIVDEFIDFVKENNMYDEYLLNKIKSYQDILENIKDADITSFALKFKIENLVADFQEILANLSGEKLIDTKEKIITGLLSIFKILARQNNLYPSEIIMFDEGNLQININKKYINFERQVLANEIKKMLNSNKG